MASQFSRHDSAPESAAALGNEPPLDLRRIFDLSQDLMCITDPQTRFLRVSASSARILGYEPRELIGRKFLDLVHPHDLQSTLLAHESVQRGAQIVEFENRYIRKDGVCVDLSWTASSIAAEPGAGASYSIARDITNRKRAERLRESQREVLQMMVAGAALADVLRRICSIMEAFDADAKCAVTVLDAVAGRARAAFSPSLPSRFLSVIRDKLLTDSNGACANTLRNGQTATCIDMEQDPEWRELSALGAEHGLRACWFTPVFGARARLIAVLAVYYSHPHEPTHRELVLMQAAVSLVALAIAHSNAQTQLKESLARVELAQSIARLGYWERDLSSDNLNVYGEANAILGIPAERSVSLAAFLAVVIEEDRPALLAAYGEANRGDTPGDTPGELQFRVRHPNGAIRHVHAKRMAIHDESGRATHIIGTMQDITELEERVRTRTQQLQESNRELEAFSYSVSHDLRGPLRAIAGFTGLLRDQHYETIDADGRRYIDRVLAGTQRMSNLIDDLLELGRVTRVEIRRRQVDLSEYARAIVARLREASAGRAAAIVIEPQLRVEGDPGLLEIALVNLLDNAWKFTAGRPVAEIRFGAVQETCQEAAEGERILFVRDNGVGFDPRYAANLFGVFQRLHAAGEFPGTGVGLATVQRIVQRHGGRIWADAAVDRGATIYFTIAKGQQ